MPRTELYQRLRSANVCTSCTKRSADSGGAHCLQCKAANVSAFQARYNRRRSIGACGQCGDVTVEGRSICASCRDRQHVRAKTARTERSIKGSCRRCGSPPLPNRKTCEKCTAERNREALRRIDLGLCRRCGAQDPLPGYTKCSTCKDISNRHARERARKERIKVLSHYGAICACCGETQEKFLSVDHVNNDGNLHRKSLKRTSIMPWIIKHNFPSSLQILCHNCNMAKALYGQCPHKTSVEF